MASNLEGVGAVLGVDGMVVWERVLGIVRSGKKEKAGRILKCSILAPAYPWDSTHLSPITEAIDYRKYIVVG